RLHQRPDHRPGWWLDHHQVPLHRSPHRPARSQLTAEGRMAIKLDDYRLLGRSGLRVSPLSLGTMTFGVESGWGSTDEEARRMVDRFIELGGNFFDSANFYAGGRSEQLLGEALRGRRDQAVIATKYSLTMRPGDPNAGGNHRKNMMQAV